MWRAIHTDVQDQRYKEPERLKVDDDDDDDDDNNNNNNNYWKW
jgi:hypothetical protein